MTENINLQRFSFFDWPRSINKKNCRYWVIAIFVCQFLMPFGQSWAARDAVVLNDRSIIYADMQKTSPIGFVRKGKVLRVGEVPRKGGTMLPVLVSGKIAYIETKNIILEKKENISEKSLERVKRKKSPVEGVGLMQFKRTNYFRSDASSFIFPDEFSTYGLEIKGGVIYKDHWQFRLGADLQTSMLSSNIYRFTTIFLEVGANFFRVGKGYLGVFGFVGGIPYAMSNTDMAKLRGIGFSYGGRAELSFPVKRNFIATLSGEISRISVSDFKLEEVDERANFNALSVAAGFSYVTDFIRVKK